MSESGRAAPLMADLVNCRLNRFSSERLLYFITLLDRDIEIVIRPKEAAPRMEFKKTDPRLTTDKQAEAFLAQHFSIAD